MKFKKAIILFTSACLLFSQGAFAARLGGGKSYGSQRSYSRTAQPQSYNSTTPPPTVTQQPHQGMGAGTAAVLGAAAGAAGGYMLGKSMANNESMTNTQSAMAGAENHIPWGMIGLLGMLLIIGLMLFKRRANPNMSNNTTFNNPYNNAPQQNAGFNIPTINRSQSVAMGQTSAYNVNNQPNSSMPPVSTLNQNKMPDGVETVYFLRQVKGMFLHIQSMNSMENINEISKYMTPELYNAIKAEIANNPSLADFSNLDCLLLNCETTGNGLEASVKFFGMVSEEAGSQPKPFTEVWNFIKTDLSFGKWLVSGIQQDSIS